MSTCLEKQRSTLQKMPLPKGRDFRQRSLAGSDYPPATNCRNSVLPVRPEAMQASGKVMTASGRVRVAATLAEIGYWPVHSISKPEERIEALHQWVSRLPWSASLYVTVIRLIT